MGYELHIVRQVDYDDEEEESDISLHEWLEYVSTDKELELKNGYTLNIPGVESNWQNSPGFCEWSIHKREDASIPWFDYGSGCISSKFPDDKMIEKMIKISKVLKARVRGDDYEYYDENYLVDKQVILDPQKHNVTPYKSQTIKKPWWKFW